MFRMMLVAAAGFAFTTSARGGQPDPRGLEFFEKKIRPVLVDQCYSCHSKEGNKSRGGLLLDTREGLLQGGDTGAALVPGFPEKSLLIHALRQKDDLRMPPKGKLSDAVIADFETWIAQGAFDPRTSSGPTPRRSAFTITAEDRAHWSFRPLDKPKPPPVKNSDWAKTEIDAFVLAKLEGKKLSPARPADRFTLLRRATYDLTGLPPTPGEIEAFIQDNSPQAFARVVDRLLVSPGFGERWGRHWLDGVRYATSVDKSGLYRDWVIRAFQNDLPYDEFVRLQIAADLIPAKETDPAKIHVSGASLEHLPATGFLALAVWELVARDLAVAEIVDSQIDVVSRQFLGITLACARCHDHKFDPFSNEDYFGLAGIFFSSHISPGKLVADGRLSGDVITIPLMSQADRAAFSRIQGEIDILQKQIADREARIGPAARLYQVRLDQKNLEPTLAKATGTAKKDLEKKLGALKNEEKKLLEDKARKGWREDPPDLAEVVGLREKVAQLEKARTPRQAIGILEGGVPGSNRQKIGDAPIYIRGDHRKEGKVVPRQFPVLFAGETQKPLGQQTKGSGRLELANWIASPQNPLTARVMVNRVWQHLFGQGLVRTPDNFGRLGEAPTHPDLLDFLAQRFIDSGWSVRTLIRDILLSSTYQQSSFAGPELFQADPENRLLGRMSRKRLEYEALRDSILFISGQLGPDAKSSAKRTVYEPVERRQVNAMRSMFDGADPLGIVAERSATTTTPQALFLMNNPLVSDAAAELEKTLRRQIPTDERQRVRQAYLMLLGRIPNAEEMDIGVEYVQRGNWSRYLQVLLCTNEFMYLD